MRFVHLSDLHLGKRLNEHSLIDDQKYILTQIINIIDDEKPDAIIIAGDIYDKSVPSAEAVELFDDFLVRLAKRSIPVFVISGNHDSPERLAFGSRLIDSTGIHLSPVYDGVIKPFILRDEHGDVNIYMLPFIKPVHVRAAFPDEEIKTYTDAMKTAIKNMNVDTGVRNVLITHQFVTGAQRSDSEELSVGGSDNIDADVFSDFDYVALGHIHGPQNIGSERIRYCGTPLKYSFSEASHQKSVTVATLGTKGDLSLKTVPLVPLHDLIVLKGSYDEVTAKSFYDGTSYREDYTRIILTDEEDIPDAVSRLRVIYTNLMSLDYDNTRTRRGSMRLAAADIETKSPLELFSEFYLKQNGMEMTDEQAGMVSSLIESIWEDEQ